MTLQYSSHRSELLKLLTIYRVYSLKNVTLAPYIFMSHQKTVYIIRYSSLIFDQECSSLCKTIFTLRIMKISGKKKSPTSKNIAQT